MSNHQPRVEARKHDRWTKKFSNLLIGMNPSWVPVSTAQEHLQSGR